MRGVRVRRGIKNLCARKEAGREQAGGQRCGHCGRYCEQALGRTGTVPAGRSVAVLPVRGARAAAIDVMTGLVPVHVEGFCRLARVWVQRKRVEGLSKGNQHHEARPTTRRFELADGDRTTTRTRTARRRGDAIG